MAWDQHKVYCKAVSSGKLPLHSFRPAIGADYHDFNFSLRHPLSTDVQKYLAANQYWIVLDG
eukprot:2512861-Rhodomonas_salina.1